jgi:hypothetical protein
MNDHLMQELKRLSGAPGRETSEWLSNAESAIEFLKANAQSDTLVLFASMDSVLIHAALVPLANLDPPDQNDLSHDFLTIDESWAIEHVSGGGEPDRVYLSPPMGRHGKSLRGGEKLFFIRSFEGSRRSWPAPGSEDTKFGVTMGPEVSHAETKVYTGLQA